MREWWTSSGALVDSPRFGKVLDLLKARFISKLVSDTMRVVANIGTGQLKEINREAIEKRDYMLAVLTRFRLDLDEAEDNEAR